MNFSNIAVCCTFIPLNLFFGVLAHILTLFWEVSYDSLEWTRLATTYKLLTLKLLHHPIPKQNLHHLSSRTDPLGAPHDLTHFEYTGPLNFTTERGPGKPFPWVSGLCTWWGEGSPSLPPAALDQRQETWAVPCNSSSPHLLGNEWKWGEHMEPKQMVGWIPWCVRHRELHKAEALAPTV